MLRLNGVGKYFFQAGYRFCPFEKVMMSSSAKFVIFEYGQNLATRWYLGPILFRFCCESWDIIYTYIYIYKLTFRVHTTVS